MLLVFIDETSDTKFKAYLGLSLALINARFYPSLKSAAQKILLASGWDPTVEFKGSYLFSITKGCPSVSVEKRLSAARNLLALNVATANSRMQFHFGALGAPSPSSAYLASLPSLLFKALPKPPSGAGKNLLAVFCDERQDVSVDQLQGALAPAANEKGYVLLERVVSCRSSFDTIGIMFADLVGYLAGRVHVISNDLGFFEALSDEQVAGNAKLKKLQTSQALISAVKQLSFYNHNVYLNGRAPR